MDNIFNIFSDETISCLLRKESGAQSRLAQFAMDFGIRGNVIRHYIAYKLATDENPFSLACEFSPMPKYSIFEIANQNLESIFNLYCTGTDDKLYEIYADFIDWQSGKAGKYEKAAAKTIKRLTANLDNCVSARKFTLSLGRFYSKHGVGEFALNTAFGLNRNGNLKAIALGKGRKMSELIGLDSQKNALRDNTRALIQGRRANNILLYGDGGTGKTTSIKALLNEYGEEGLRIIEIYKHQFAHIPEVIERIKRRKYKFILFMDDLSFEDSETEYKYLKALIDGGLAAMPDNVAVYATSNRRHIIKESWKDRDDNDDDLHRYDTVEEKLALVKRFGLTLYYPSPNQKEYLEIVHALAQRAGIKVDSELDGAALRWEIREGGKSGRTAEQFINSIIKNKSRI